MKNKKFKLKVYDFFHIEVVETTESENDREGGMAKFKLEIKDGPMKNHYLYIDLRLNPHIKRIK